MGQNTREAFLRFREPNQLKFHQILAQSTKSQNFIFRHHIQQILSPPNFIVRHTISNLGT